MYKRKLRHLRTQQFNIAYHWYLPERNILLLVDQHNVFQAFRLTNKTIAKVCKFELSCSKTSFGFFLQSVSLSSSRTGKGKNRNLHPAVQAQAQAQQQQLLNSANQKRSDQPHDSYGSSSSGNGVSRHSHHHNTHNKDSESDRSPDAPEAPILGFCSRQISMWRIYESTIIIFINERKGRMHIFTLTNDTMEQSYVYDLHSPGKYFLSLVDHVLIAHNTTLNLSTIFDIRSNSKANLVPPSPIFHPLVSVNTDSILSQSNYTNNRDNNNDKNKKNNDTHENNDIDSNGTHGNEAYCRNDGVSYEHGRFVAPHFYFEKDSRDARDASTTRTYHYNKKRAGGKTEGEGRGKQYTNGGGTGGDGRMGMDMDMDTPGQGRFYTLKLDLTQIGQAWEANKQTRLVDFLLKRRSLLAKNLIFALVRRKLAAGGSLALLSKIFSILNRVCYNAYVTSGKVGLYAAVTSTQYTGSQPSSHQPSPSSSGTSTPSHTRSSGSSSSSHSSTPQFHSSSSRHQHHAQSSRRQLVHDQTPNTHTQYPRNYTPDHDDDDDLNSNHNNDYTSKLGDGLLSVFRSPYGDGDDGEGGGDGDGAAGSSYLSPAELAHKRLKAHILHFYGNQHYALDARTIEHTESGYTVITQEQMYQHVFLPLFVSAFISPTPSSSAVSAAATSGENTGCGVNIHGAGNSSSGCDGDDDDDKGGDRINNPRPTAAVLVPALAEYLRSIYRHYMSTEDFLNDLLVDLFIIDKRYYEFHQYLQYHILNDSTTIATKLLQLSDCYLSAYQLGIDMIYRLNAFDLLLSSLLERREIVTALQLIPYRSPLFTRPGLKPCDFLAAARQKNICTFYSAFKFFEARNIVLRHSPEFPVEEGCSHFAVEFQTLFADFALQSSTLPSPLTALHPGSVEYSPPSSTVSSLSVSVTSTSPHADGNGGRDDSGGNIGGSYASERVDNDDNANKDGSGDKGATTASDVGGKSVSDGNLGDVSGTSDSPMKDSQVVDESAADGTNADTEERRAAEEEDKVHETVASTRKDRDADSAAIMADTNGYGLDADAKTDVKVDNLRERLGDFDIDEDDSSEYYYDDEDEAYE